MADNEECRTCKFWRVDNGMWTMTGWSGSGEDGNCHYDKHPIPKRANSFCALYQSKASPSPAPREEVR
jgi:hypothetical protein